MPKRRFERMISAQRLMSGCAIVFAACITIKHAQAQYIPPPTPLPPPILNPSTPYTVPQPPYQPIAPSAPSATSGYVSSPVGEPVPPTSARSHHRPFVRTSVATRRSVHRRGHATIVRAAPESYSYYDSPFGYGYGCAWRRAWDGYWFRTSPCS
jgi:hypothetical protein